MADGCSRYPKFDDELRLLALETEDTLDDNELDDDGWSSVLDEFDDDDDSELSEKEVDDSELDDDELDDDWFDWLDDESELELDKDDYDESELLELDKDDDDESELDSDAYSVSP